MQTDSKRKLKNRQWQWTRVKPENPSKRKFRIARKFVEELKKIYENDLLAVFVTGSVAANMALPESDIDMVFVVDLKDLKERGKKMQRVLQTASFWDVQQAYIAPQEINKQTFEYIGGIGNMDVREQLHRPDLKFIHDDLLDGAVPIFGNTEYLKKFEGTVFRKPSLRRIRRYQKRSDNMQRVSFKRPTKGRQRFLPR